MSVFRKPKRNLRIRNLGEDDEENNEMDITQENNDPGTFKKDKSEKKKHGEKQKPKKPTLLSFGDEEEEEEVFQIKKSSHSKKLVRMLDRERKKKNKVEEKMDVDEVVEDDADNFMAKVKTDDIVVVLKKSEEDKARKPEIKKDIILNGRAATAAGKNDMSSSDEDEGATKHKFSSPDHVKIYLESGRIPDAATIHAARKSRQRARELGNDYIPINNNSNNVKKESKKNKSRLVRDDDDNDNSEEDERINMTVNLEQQDRNARRENYESTAYNDDDEWETQQIKKGVSNVQLLTQPNIEHITTRTTTSLFHTSHQPHSLFSSGLSLSDGNSISPQGITDRLRQRLRELKEMREKHEADKKQVLQDLQDCVLETKELEDDAPGLAEKFRFYQELRGYVTDLVECLDEKVPRLVSLEEKVLSFWSDRTEMLNERRRQDVRDQVDELSQTSKNANVIQRWTKEEEEMRVRRAAEREGRRTRRRRVREVKGINTVHVDGMSSDDEFTELEFTGFRLKLDEINKLNEHLLEDVEEEFGTVDGVSSRMEKWRLFDMEAYTEAYASLCLPKLLGPLVRIHMLTWNPLQQVDCMDYESSRWWGRLLLYAVRNGETSESLLGDPDVTLVPLVVEKIIIPKFTKIIEETWDPMSSSQTLRIVGLTSKLVNETPTLIPTSKQLENLFQTVVKKLKLAVDNDMFIPIQLKMSSEQKAGAALFFQRQFASAVKLLRNILSFQGLLGTEHLQELALDSLLNRYLLTALRTCTPCDAVQKSNVILSTFPRWWFQGDTKVQRLLMFANYLKQISGQVHEYDTTEKDAYDLVHTMLRTLAPALPST